MREFDRLPEDARDRCDAATRDVAEHRSVTLEGAAAALSAAARLREASAPGSEQVHTPTPASPNRLDQLLPSADEATKAKLVDTIDRVLRARPDFLRESVELAVVKAWTGTLQGQRSRLDAEARTLGKAILGAVPRCSATGRAARYVHAGLEGKRRPFHRLLWALVLPRGLGPFYDTE